VYDQDFVGRFLGLTASTNAPRFWEGEGGKKEGRHVTSAMERKMVALSLIWGKKNTLVPKYHGPWSRSWQSAKKKVGLCKGDKAMQELGAF